MKKYSQEEIEELIACPKRIIAPPRKDMKPERGSLRNDMELVHSLFYEILEEIIEERLKQYTPRPHIFPLPERDDLEVDYQFDIKPYPIYLFGVKDSAKARLATICCLEFQRAKLKFKGFVVHEDFDGLSKKDRNRITSATDKQFISLDDFRANAQQVLEREAA